MVVIYASSSKFGKKQIIWVSFTETVRLKPDIGVQMKLIVEDGFKKKKSILKASFFTIKTAKFTLYFQFNLTNKFRKQ